MTALDHTAGCGCMHVDPRDEQNKKWNGSVMRTPSSGQWTHMITMSMWRTGSKIFWLQSIFLILLLTLPLPVSSLSDFHTSSDSTWTYAKVTLRYNHVTFKNKTIEERDEFGRFGTGPIGPAQGIVIHGNATGCIPYILKTTARRGSWQQSWIALVKRGGCSEGTKIEYAQRANASAVVIYNDQPGTEITTITNPGRKFLGQSNTVTLQSRPSFLRSSIDPELLQLSLTAFQECDL